MAITSRSLFLSIRKSKYQHDIASKMTQLCLFDSHFTLESKLGWHRFFLTVESTRVIRTPVVVSELLEEMVSWGCRSGRFNEQFQILRLELNVKFI